MKNIDCFSMKNNLYLLNLPSEIRTQIFVDFSLQLSFRTSCKPSATASGISPPPCALHSSNHVFICLMEFVKSWTLVTNVCSCGGWSRYSTNAKRISDFSDATISSTISLILWKILKLAQLRSIIIDLLNY